MRSFWSGSITFGLVNIPIRVYSASEEQGLDLDMLHKKDLSPIRYARMCKAEGKEVPYDEIVKGYEYTKGDYIVLTDEDFEAANAKKTKAIEIFNFVDETEIDVVYYDKPYFLEPDKGAARPYALLREALTQSKRVALARFVFRNREKIGILKAKGDALILNQIRYAHQLRDEKDLNLPEIEVSSKELAMAMALIDQMTGAFEPGEYKDTYRDDLMRVIEEKAQGKTPRVEAEEPQQTKVLDIMDALRKSLERQKGGKPAAAAKASGARRAAPKTAAATKKKAAPKKPAGRKRSGASEARA